ncbi:autotransporter domain-containing protein [uncultured Rhodoblastus sp.]|uniref:autotransporter domain-containing protein n=1 Tax=uncultured Rhodoblastus sp. TaxID=543037 RepID=UPI0025FDEBC3|nr:autotransporter domain-containing protein [uncultured Rhodoblastus sp.]
MALLLSSSAIAALLAAAPPASAQTPPGYNASLQYGLGLIGAPAAWNSVGNYIGTGVTIAVADTGIVNNQVPPGFSGAGKIDPRSRNFVLPAPGEIEGPGDYYDLASHGTHVSGIILASGDSSSPGVAYNANVVMLRALADTAACENQNCNAPGVNNALAESLIYFADLKDVRIYNGSWGPALPFGTKGLTKWEVDAEEAAWAGAALYAISKGKIIVAAAGNDRQSNPVAGLNPSGLALYPFIRPGVNANAGVYSDGGANLNFSTLLQQSGLIIGVTAVGKDKNISTFANACGVTASWCVAAPGGNPAERGGTDPAATPGIYSTFPFGYPKPTDTGYGFNYGTSMAAPMVSGALGLLSGAYPNYNSQDLAHVLFATAENVRGEAGVNAVYGYGMIRLDRAVSGPTTLAAGHEEKVDYQQMTYWSQPLAAAGGFTKTGAGYLIVAGRTSAAGDVMVSGGALGVDGTLTLATKLLIEQGATLAGFGWIKGDTVIDGVLNAGQLPNYGDLVAYFGGVLPASIPLTGTSPGTLTFSGNVALGATANTRVNVDGPLQVPGGPGTYDKIVVEGANHTFTANGVLTPVLRGIPGGSNTYVPTIGAVFPFLTALNGASVTGSFAGLIQPTDGLLAPNARFDVVYAPYGLTLDVTPASFATLAATLSLNANQRALAGVLDRVRPPAGPALSGTVRTIYDSLYGQDVSGSAAALGALSGQGQAATAGAVLDAFSAFSGVIADRQAMLLAGLGDVQAALTPNMAFSYSSTTGPVFQALAGQGVPFPTEAAPAAPIAKPQWTTWGQGYGRWSRVGAADGLPGANTSSGGFAIGGDGLVGPDLIAGGALGYTYTSTGSDFTKATGNTYAGALYATWTPGPLVFDGRLAAGPSSGGASRTISFPGQFASASGSINGWGGLIAGDAGYRFDVEGTTLKPFVGLTGQTFNRRAFNETTDFGLSFPSQSFNRLTSEVGLWATRLFHNGLTTYMVQLKGSWTEDFGNQALTTQAALLDQPFTIAAANPGRAAAVLAVNLAAWQTENVALFAKYEGQFRGNATSSEAALGVRVKW